MLRIAVHCAQHILLIINSKKSCRILMYLHHVTLYILALELGASGLGLGQVFGSEMIPKFRSSSTQVMKLHETVSVFSLQLLFVKQLASSEAEKHLKSQHLT